MGEPMVTIDLVKLMRLTVDQVQGSDERDMLEAWLARNGEGILDIDEMPTQYVSVRLVDVLKVAEHG